MSPMSAPPALLPQSLAALRVWPAPVASRAPDPPVHPSVPIVLGTPLRV